MERELAYSFHLGSDKNKSKLAKKVSKGNVSGTTSLSNNAIQNANDLSRVNKHNLRDYDNEKVLIRVIYGTDNIVNDVQQLYLTDMINDMDIKDKLRLAICIIQSKWYGLIYNTKENYEKFDIMLKDIDEEYRTTLINFGKYKLVMFAMAKLMEMKTAEQNKVALYLFNRIS